MCWFVGTHFIALNFLNVHFPSKTCLFIFLILIAQHRARHRVGTQILNLESMTTYASIIPFLQYEVGEYSAFSHPCTFCRIDNSQIYISDFAEYIIPQIILVISHFKRDHQDLFLKSCLFLGFFKRQDKALVFNFQIKITFQVCVSGGLVIKRQKAKASPYRLHTTTFTFPLFSLSL